MREITYDETKFGELLILVAGRSAEDPTFGATKLNKLLFFSDFYAYANLGEPITGAVYQRLQNGPAPKRLLPVQGQLEREGAVTVVDRKTSVYTQKVTRAERSPDLDQFNPDQLDLVDEILKLCYRHNASTISEISHRISAGWNLVDEGEEIPYDTALISMDPPSPAALSRGAEVARKLGWRTA